MTREPVRKCKVQVGRVASTSRRPGCAMAAVRQPGILLRLVNAAVFFFLDIADVVVGWLLRWLDVFLLPSCADASCRCKQASHQAGQAVLYRSQGQDCGCWGLKSEVGEISIPTIPRFQQNSFFRSK